MTITATVGRRGQITLPRAIRQWLNLQEGDHIIFTRRGDDVILQPVQPRSLRPPARHHRHHASLIG